MTLTICETCGSPVHRESEGCENCGESVPPRDEIRRLPHEVVLSFLEHAEELLESSPLRQAVLAFVAGSFIARAAKEHLRQEHVYFGEQCRAGEDNQNKAC